MHPFGLQAVTPIRLILHAPGASGLRWLWSGFDLMTTNSAGFYRQGGFRDADPQQLLGLKR